MLWFFPSEDKVGLSSSKKEITGFFYIFYISFCEYIIIKCLERYITENKWWASYDCNAASIIDVYLQNTSLIVCYEPDLNEETKAVTHRNCLAAFHRQLHKLSKSSHDMSFIPFCNMTQEIWPTACRTISQLF